ncbi:EF-hand domain-containing protein [Streptomyces clavuligerus]|uniref:Calcium-binding EF-hand-containing protein n=1 Tax=Streptomyces clavuligerus TaxID=1901 RepID=E2Q821_STRCL|nr:EF-hand domain-containing protein [Streptomyces clavuligerus]ANW17893.1 calcium-binding protein [Streptomyces clavuligerus]AXU12447.1 EF-hand domain-containing protein [Streptomyces clavuligerus]EFG09553.1 Calcium-binding EF-hand-containing protein [Streptomyces clavuligerus]MBY6302338.1 EF-hand domain-containing protein [Streptomyces clavuligerus]QCS05229.1 EF-hand domain-containing protein [Streptomyces clavuligerus]
MSERERTVLDEKLDRSFGMLDTDGDGRIRERDLVCLAEKLNAAFSGGAPEAVARLERAFTVLWTTDLRPMDADGDEAIDRAEWSMGVRRAVADDRAGFLRRMGTVLQAWLALCDRDADGRIDRRAFTTMYGRTLGVPDAALTEAFTTLDIDGDGYVGHDEVRAAAEEYCTSESRDTPGNWLLGPL